MNSIRPLWKYALCLFFEKCTDVPFMHLFGPSAIIWGAGLTMLSIVCVKYKKYKAAEEKSSMGEEEY